MERIAWPTYLLVAAVVVLTAGLFLPITDGDTATYGKVAKNVLASGDWVLFSYRGDGVFDKPPLTIWLISLSFAAFGSTEWAIHLWHHLLGFATVGAAYALARLALPVRQSVFAALILLASAQFFYQGLVPQQDVPLTLFVTLAIYWYLRWEQHGRAWMMVAACAAMALAVLSKGLIGLVLPILVVVLHGMLDRPKWPARAVPAVGWGVLTFLVLASPWYIAGAMRVGRAFIDIFFLGGSLGIGRFFKPALSVPSGPVRWLGFLAYAIFLPLGVLPWTGWLWPALREGWRARLRSPVLRVCALWVVGIIVFHSVAPGDKVIRYQLPALPAFAVLAASVVEDPRWSRPAAWVSGVLALLVALVLVGITQVPLSADARAFLPLVGAFLPPLAGALGAYSVSTFNGQARRGLVLLVVMTLAAYGLLVAATARHWDRISPWRPLARIVNAAPGAAPVLVVGPQTPFADYYIERSVEYVDAAGLSAAWRRGPVLAVLPPGAFANVPQGTRPVIVGQVSGWLVVTNAIGP